jgi:hypothetical protein
VSSKIDRSTTAHRRLRGSAFSRGLVTLALASAVVSCQAAPLPPRDVPHGPTRLPAPGSVRVEIAWENQANRPYVLTLAEGKAIRAYAFVEACSDDSVIAYLNTPFAVGLSLRSDEAAPSAPARTIQQQLAAPPDNRFGLAVTIDAAGSVTQKRLVGEPQPGTGKACGR